MDDVRDERARVAVRPQPRPGLVPDQVALGHEPGRRGARREVGPGEQVAPVLVGVANDDHRVAPVAQHPHGARRTTSPSGRGTPGSRRRWRGRRVEVGDHRVVGPAVGVRLGQRAAGHRHRQLEVVRRIGGDEVDRVGRQRRQDRQRVADAQLQPGLDRSRAARPDRPCPRSASSGPESVAFAEQVPDHRLVDRRPARIELDADGAARPARDRGAEERPADAGERDPARVRRSG